jgi:hypothetical protein
VSPFRPSFLHPPALHPQIGRFLTPLFSSTSELLFSQLLCFHNHLRCPLVFPHVQRVSTRNPLSPFPLITSLQTQQLHTITHSFAQRRRAIPPIFNRFRTLSIATGVYPPGRPLATKFQFQCQSETLRAAALRNSDSFSDPKEVTATNTAACYSKHLRRSTSFRLSSTRRLPARVPHPRCDPQHLSTCGRLGDEITGCFSKPAA